MRWLALVALVLTGPAFAEARNSAKFLEPRKITGPRMTNQMCAPSADVELTLRDRYNEERVWTRVATSRIRYQYWEGPKSWTIISITRGTSCVMTAGVFGGASS